MISLILLILSFVALFSAALTAIYFPPTDMSAYISHFIMWVSVIHFCVKIWIELLRKNDGY